VHPFIPDLEGGASGPCGAVIVYGNEKVENLPRFVNA